MSKIKLDLSQFKHVRSNAKTTTLRHKDGHELTIAHNSLSPEGQAQLSQLAKISETPQQADEMMHKGASMAKGGPVNAANQKLAESKKTPPSNKFPMPSSIATDANPMADGGNVGVTPRSEYFAQGGNAGEKRKEIFGTKSSPSNPEMRAKHMEHISKYSEKNFGMPIQPSGGKINPKTGQRRDENPELGVDKPDWRSGQLESQSNPDAMVHELAHLLLLPKGMPLKEGQKYMDRQYAEVQKNYGYMKQKQSQGEIQPMAIENILRRHLGLPAATQSVSVKEGQGPRMAVDTGTPAAVRVQKGEKAIDLIRQSRLLSPENRKRMEEFVSGKIKFHPATGWQENPEALGALSRMYKEEHPNAVKKMADGGQAEDDATPPAQSTPLDPQQDKARAAVKGLNEPASQQLSEGWQRLLHPSTWMAEGGEAESPNWVDQNPEAKPSQAEADAMMTHEQTNPLAVENLPKLTPEQEEMAQKIGMGSMGTVGEVAAIPENLGPEIQATAEKLSQAMSERGIDDQVTQTLAQKLKGLHMALGQYVGRCSGGKIGYDDGGKVHKSEEPPASLSANEEDLDPTTVPTQMAGESVPQMSDEQVAYKRGHDAYSAGQPRNTNPILAGMEGPALAAQAAKKLFQSPEQNEADAAEAGLNNVALMHEDKAAQALNEEQRHVRTAKINSQLAAIGQPPLPGTNQPDAIDSVPPQPDQRMAMLNSAQQPAMRAPGDEFDKYEGMVGQGYQDELAGIRQAAEVAGQRGSLEQAALEQDLRNKQAAAQTFQNSFQELNNERMAHIADIQKGYIDPEQYWKGTKNPETGEMEGGHSKLMAGIGMILAGFNPTSNPNQAVQMLQYQMNRNLEAQKMNLVAKQNLLMANLHQFNNLQDATDMTRIMQHDMVANELQQAAARTAAPAAKAAALQAAGALQMQTAPLMQQFAMRRAFMRLANSGANSTGATEQMLNYMEASGMPQAKEMRNRYVPGLGLAGVETVPQEVKDRIAAYQNVERLMNQSMEFARAHEYNLSAMNPSERAAGETLRNELMSQIRTAEKQGVYKESEARFMIDTLGGNTADFFNAVRTQPKLHEMQQMKTNEYHNLLKNLGGNLLHNAQAVQAPIHAAPQNIVHDASGKPYTRQIINGKAYMIPVGVSK